MEYGKELERFQKLLQSVITENDCDGVAGEEEQEIEEDQENPVKMDNDEEWPGDSNSKPTLDSEPKETREDGIERDVSTDKKKCR